MPRALALLLPSLALLACSSPPHLATQVSVSGQVVDSGSGPLAGAQVRIGTNAPAVTGADGRFSIAGVTVPYDAIVIAAGFSGYTTVTVYQGLARSDPVLHAFGSAAQPFTASLAGSIAISGASFPLPANGVAKLSFGTPDLRRYIVPDLATGAWSDLAFTWSGASTQTGTLRALAWVKDATGKPSTFSGFATMPLSFSDGASLTGQALTLQSVAQAFVTGTVHHPADHLLTGRSTYVSFGPNTQIGLAFEFPAAGSTVISDAYSFVVPAVAASSLYVSAFASKASGASSSAARAGLAAGATGADLTLQEAPEALQPADAATGVGYATPFSWTPFAGGVHLLQVFSNTTATAPAYYLVTAAAEGRIPDLSSLGLALPPATVYQWFVSAVAPCASADEVATLDGCSLFTDSHLRDYRSGTTSIRSFTTR